MKLKEVLEMIGEKEKIALCYVGDTDYALTTKKEICKTTLLEKDVRSMRALKVEGKSITAMAIRIYK